MGLPTAFHFWKALWLGKTLGLTDYRLAYSLAVLVPAICLDWAQSKGADEVFFLQQKWGVQAVLLATVIILILIVTDLGPGQPFIYQGF